MKLLFQYCLLLLSLGLSPQDRVLDHDRLLEILGSSHFTISVERLDHGYTHNQQFYVFERDAEKLKVSHNHLKLNYTDSGLQNTILKLEALDSLEQFCWSIRELNEQYPRKSARQFNKSSFHDLVHVYNQDDTLTFSDVNSKAWKEFNTLIHNCEK